LLQVQCANPDIITNLPGLPPVNFTQYAGYIDVDPSVGRFLYYWFVESQRDPATDKLVLWLNGGPGCSSIGGGLMTENGPFRVNPDGATLSMNPTSWNFVANVLYLESPAGVGFSYSNNPNDYNVGDYRTANDAYTFLQGFFQLYPQFQNTKFWITGESYGGHYVPELAQRIIEGNANLQPGDITIQLEGIMVGNAWTVPPVDNFGAVYYWWTHAMISDQTFEGIYTTCNFSWNGPFDQKRSVNQEACNNFVNTASTEMGNIDIYDIYVDVCLSSQNDKIIHQMARAGSQFHQMLDRTSSERNTINPPYLPCADEYTQTYLNTPAIWEAIHVTTNFSWSDCNGKINYNYSDVMSSVADLYDKFLLDNLKVLIYSGDVDAIVPYAGTRQWIADLQRNIVQPWQPYMVQNQVGGYYTVYEGLTFATVRNAGHMVPQTQPERGLHMFSNFLYGTPF